MNRKILERLPSYWWPGFAVVFVLECGHRHVRPVNWRADVGDSFRCCFCDDEAPPA
jgi:hypothetical protein